MKGTLNKAFGYQDNKMNLPVADLASALPFYEKVLGFRVESRADAPRRSVVLARDLVQIGLAENGGDPSQDGCAFHVDNVDALREEFQARLPEKQLSAIGVEKRGDKSWRVFYVVAPDGLCYWFGELDSAR
jgi:catechol 2,3-dioxygenase-like lactoylglutathione lyase family enzyme